MLRTFLTFTLSATALLAQRPPSDASAPLPSSPSIGQDVAARHAALAQQDGSGPIAGGSGWTPPPVGVEIHTADADPVGGEYGIWAAGQDYKVSFHDGATYVPYLGRDYPHNQPFRWSTTSVTVGEHELVTRAAPRQRRMSATRYEYDHGGVVEAYDVLLEGLEQTFVIADRPSSTGDLVVRGTVDTQLTAPRAENEHTDVRFFDHNGDPILTYGKATALDAAGSSMPMTTTFHDGAFELRLDGEWLQNATFPVVVDPLMFSNVLLNTWGQPFGYSVALDVLREEERSTENVWICYTRQVSATDEDVWVMRTNDDLPGSLFVVAFTDITSNWGNGSCALATADSRVVCAFVRNTGNFRHVRWHTHQVNDLNFRSGVGYFNTSNKAWRVDVGGNRGNTPGQRVLVVYQHEQDTGGAFANTSESESRGFYIDLAGISGQLGQGNDVDPFTILAASNNDCERPRVNQVADGYGGNHWCVTHQYVESNDPTDDWDAYIDIWGESGNLLAYADLAPNNGKHKLGPIPAGSRGRYLVVYGGADATLGPQTTIVGFEINTQRIDFSTTAGITFPHPEHRLLTSSSRRLETKAIAFDHNSRSHWLVVNRSSNILFADQLGYRGAYEEFDNFIQGPSNVTTVRQAAIGFNDDDDTYILVGSEFATGSHPIRGNIWSNPTIPGPTTAGIACSSASPMWEPTGFNPNLQRIGYEFGGVTVYGVPSNGLVVLGASLNTANISIGNIPGVGSGCTQLISNTAGFLGFLPIRIAGPLNAVRWNLPLAENFFPTTLHFQAFHLDASSSVFLSTKRLSVPINY